MQPKLQSKTMVPWGIPALLWTASLAMLAAGLIGDSALIGIGFVMAVSAALATLSALGSATALMDPVQSESKRE